MAGVRASGGGRKQNLPAARKSTITRIAPPPSLMSDVAISLWKSTSKFLIEREIFEPVDAPILLSYCNAFHLMLEAEKMIAEDGIIALGESGMKKHPAINVRNDNVAALARLGSLLGLDPMSRSRMLTATKPDEDKGNEFDEF